MRFFSICLVCFLCFIVYSSDAFAWGNGRVRVRRGFFGGVRVSAPAGVNVNVGARHRFRGGVNVGVGRHFHHRSPVIIRQPAVVYPQYGFGFGSVQQINIGGYYGGYGSCGSGIIGY